MKNSYKSSKIKCYPSLFAFSRTRVMAPEQPEQVICIMSKYEMMPETFNMPNLDVKLVCVLLSLRGNQGIVKGKRIQKDTPWRLLVVLVNSQQAVR